MQASKIEYRLRGFIMTAIVLLGFWAPWIQALDLGKRVSLLEWMALELSRSGALRFTYATPVVIVAGALLAAVGMILRVWGTAYLGPAIVNRSSLQAGALRIDGPYRHLRNPLFLGTWFMLMAVAFLMPPTGALFALPLLTVFLVRLILAEEKFLAAAMGETYRLYREETPRLLPRWHSPLPRGGQKPRWLPALAAELNPINVFITLAVLAWSYDHELMIKGLLVGFGVSLMGRALVADKREE